MRNTFKTHSSFSKKNVDINQLASNDATIWSKSTFSSIAVTFILRYVTVHSDNENASNCKIVQVNTKRGGSSAATPFGLNLH